MTQDVGSNSDSGRAGGVVGEGGAVGLPYAPPPPKARPPRRRVLQGHVLDRLAQLPADSVDCCVTSPPYWGLRDYGLPPVVWDGAPGCVHVWDDRGYCYACNAWRGQFGLEPSLRLYVDHLMLVMREVRRVLK